jgi:hypothetical protein
MLLNPRIKRLDKKEAGELLSKELEKRKNLGYLELKEKFINQREIENFCVKGSSGVEYQVEIQGWWEDDAQENIFISCSIDNGELSAYAPLSEFFIMKLDGSIV